MSRYALRPSERAKLRRLAVQDLDAMAKHRSTNRERAEAQHLADRQALREALQHHSA